MEEQIDIGGKKVWILIEPHTHMGHQQGSPAEYFTASYTVDNPRSEQSAILFLEADKTPKCFESLVQALEYASEKLLGLSPGFATTLPYPANDNVSPLRSDR